MSWKSDQDWTFAIESPNQIHTFIVILLITSYYYCSYFIESCILKVFEKINSLRKKRFMKMPSRPSFVYTKYHPLLLMKKDNLEKECLCLWIYKHGKSIIFCRIPLSGWLLCSVGCPPTKTKIICNRRIIIIYVQHSYLPLEHCD